MDLKRLSSGEKIAATSAALLFVFMFLDWFGSRNSGELQLFSIGRTPWEALDYIPIVLVIAIIAALGAVVLKLTRAGGGPPLANVLVAILGIASALLIFFRIVNPPSFGSFQETWGTFTIEGTVQLPAFLALLAAVGIAVGGYWAMRKEGASLASLRAGGGHIRSFR